MREAAARERVRLVEAARKGDRGAFGELYGRYAVMVRSIARAYVAVEDVDDIVQEVFLRTLEKLRELRDPLLFGAWLGAITRNVARSALRATSRLIHGEPELPIAETQQHTVDARRALAVIRSLPKTYRDTLVLRLLQGMSGPEIAKRTGLTPGSVRVNLHRGMKLLRQRLTQADAGKGP